MTTVKEPVKTTRVAAPVLDPVRRAVPATPMPVEAPATPERERVPVALPTRRTRG